MRVRLRHLGLGFMLMVLPPNLWSCSSAQQEDDQLEVTEEGNFDENSALNNDNEEGFDNAANEQFAEDNEFGDGQNFDANEFGQSNDGIQEIIADLNQGQANGMSEDFQGADLVESEPMTNSFQPQPAMAAGNAGPALPEFGSKMPYIVQSGDTLARISTKVYGQPNRWADIAELSALANPSKIFPGDVIYYQLTEETLAFATNYESLPKQEIVVSAGDTLTSISSRVYGSAMDWKLIWRHNDNISNPDRLNPGTVIVYPDTRAFASNNADLSEGSKLAKQPSTQSNVYEVTFSVTTASTNFDNQSSMFELLSTVLNKTSA
jgi:LysM repeat protein